MKDEQEETHVFYSSLIPPPSSLSSTLSNLHQLFDERLEQYGGEYSQPRSFPTSEYLGDN